MADTQVASTENPTELLAVGRRHLAVKDYSAAVETLASACELLVKEHGDFADQCAEAYLWYGKSLLGLSRQESGVLGDGMPGGGNAEEEDDDDDGDGQEENGEDGQNGEAESAVNGEAAPKENGEQKKKTEPESTSKVDEPSSSKAQDVDGQPGTSNGDANDESVADLENDDDVDNLQLAWEMLDMSRSILNKRLSSGGAGAASARALLADTLLALGEVALESETYDKAVTDMQSCLELQKELYGNDDRRIAETHYQIGLANSLASNFEDAITHFKNAANILESRIKTLENPTAAANDATVKKYSTADPGYSVEGEVKELKELLPEIQEKIQDMMDYKAETIRRVRETLCPSNGASSANGESSSSIAGFSSSAVGTSSDKPATNISHLIKRKRKASDSEEGSAPKKANT